MSDEVQPTGRPCEECGSRVVVGLEPFHPGEDPELEVEGLSAHGVEWCTNLDCLSNTVLRDLRRVGVNDYVCEVCGAELHTPVSDVFAHRRAHRE